MDKQRPDQSRKKRIKRIAYTLIVIGGIGGTTVGLSRLEPAAPRVELATIYPDTVERGEMIRQVRGIGKLVPEEVRWIPATSQGIVERILVEPGVTVEPGTILVELINPELEQQTSNAALDVVAQEADLANLRVQLRSNLLNQRASAASVEADFERSTLQYAADSELNSEGLKSDLDLNLSRVQSENAARRWELEQEVLAMAQEANESQITAAIIRLEQTQAAHELLVFQLGRLIVRAGTSGVLEQVPVEVGQQLSTGANVARVSDPERLKAVLDIAETQARDIQVGQYVDVDTRNGIIPGTVTRIDPAVVEGTVTVDVRLDGDLPRGARPDLSVDGIIQIERLEDVLYVGRPSYGQANGLISMFKILPDGHAVRTRVQLGRVSVSEIEIIEGLEVGDQVILSDMSTWDEFDRIQLD
jgi:HlyD family secretion protein